MQKKADNKQNWMTADRSNGSVIGNAQIGTVSGTKVIGNAVIGGMVGNAAIGGMAVGSNTVTLPLVPKRTE